MSGPIRGTEVGPELSDAVNPDEVDESNRYAVRDNDTSQFVGVSPEYRTYASDTEKPLEAGENAPEDEEGSDDEGDEDDDADSDADQLTIPTL